MCKMWFHVAIQKFAGFSHRLAIACISALGMKAQKMQTLGAVCQCCQHIHNIESLKINKCTNTPQVAISAGKIRYNIIVAITVAVE